jgi:methyl halide transferase
VATDWEDQYRRGETPWDKGAPSPGLLEFLEEEPARGPVLVPGCGPGHDVRALAAAGAEVVGLDISESAVVAARSRAIVAGERYEQGDLFALAPPLLGAFAWVWEHTCFCAIEPALRPAYVAAVAAALRPGGRFLGIFYLDPGQGRRGEGPPFETTLMELDRLFMTHFEMLREWSPRSAYSGRKGREWMRLLKRRD